MRAARSLTVALMVLLCSGCGEEKFSRSDPKGSTERMLPNATQQEKTQFAMDCISAATDQSNPIAMGMALKQAGGDDELFSRLDGMTLVQIRAKAAEVRAKDKKQRN